MNHFPGSLCLLKSLWNLIIVNRVQLVPRQRRRVVSCFSEEFSIFELGDESIVSLLDGCISEDNDAVRFVVLEGALVASLACCTSGDSCTISLATVSLSLVQVFFVTDLNLLATSFKSF